MGEAAQALAAVEAVWIREFLVLTRERARLASSVLQPLLLLAAVGFGVGATTRFVDPRFEQVGYAQFLFPGLVAMSVMFSTVFYGGYIVADRRSDALREILLAPVPREAIYAGKVLGGVTLGLAQGLALVAAGIALRGGSVAGAALALLAVLMLSAGFAGFGLVLGSLFRSPEGYAGLVGFIVTPLFVLSGAIYPAQGLPAWLAAPTAANPATYGVDALRAGLAGVQAFPLGLDLGALAAFDLAVLALGAWAFRRMR